jgi:hypothetical protein
VTLRHALPAVLPAVAAPPAPVVAQSLPETPVTDPGVAELAVLGLLLYVVPVAFSVVVGAVVLVAAGVLLPGSHVHAVESRIHDRPVRTGVVGLVASVGGLVAFVFLLLALLALVALGVPDPVWLVAAVPFLGGVLFLYVASTLGTVALGSSVLGRLGAVEPNRWLALVVGSLLVNVPGLNLVFGSAVLLLGTGGVVEQWLTRRRDDPAGPDPQAAG